MSQRLEINLEDLLLDQQNPRLGSVDGQPDALRALVELSVSNFEGMLTSIKTHGLDPGDLFFLVDETHELGIEGGTGRRRKSAGRGAKGVARTCLARRLRTTGRDGQAAARRRGRF